MKKRIFNNWSLKLLALLFSIAIWLIIVNYDNPYTTKTITGIPIEVANEDTLLDNDMTYTLKSSQTATVRVRCQRKTAQQLRASDFKAVADFNDLYSLTNQVPVTVTCTTGKVTSDMILQSTQSIEVEMEKIISRKMDVVATTSGEPASGYKIGTISCSPSTVTVKAPQSFLDQVGSVGVDVDVTDLSQTSSQTLTLQFYSAGGSVLDTSDVTQLSVSRTDITVEVEILNVKNVNITYQVTGQDDVADGYRFSGVTVNPSTVDISGRKSVLADVSGLDLGELDVSGASENIEKTFDLRDLLPEGVSLVDESAVEVNVTLKIEKLATKTFDLGLSGLTLDGLSDDLAIGDESVTAKVTVEGLSADLEALDETEISGKADLSGLDEGKHTVSVEVEVPSGFRVVGTVNLRLELVSKETKAESADEEETGSESETASESENESEDGNEPETEPGTEPETTAGDQ